MNLRHRLAAVIVVAGLVVGGVLLITRSAPDEPGRQIQREGEGVLSSSTGHGGVSIFRPPGDPEWSATFGGLLLCVTKRGAEVRVTGVRQEGDPQPLWLRHRFRSVPPAPQRVGEATEWDPVDSALGIYPHFDRFKARGSYGPALGVIDRPCGSGAGRRAGYVELMTEMRVGNRGALIPRTFVDYSYDGRKYALLVDWRMAACGSRVPRDLCA